MIDFSGLSRSSVLGQALRLPLRLIPKEAEVRILQGPLRGCRWIAGSSNHGCWLGSYELAKQRKIVEFIEPGMTCWDVGAHVGFYTLLFARLVGPGGKVFAFEPLPRNLELLRRHVEMNACPNVHVLPLALADFDGEAAFEEASNTSMGHLSPEGRIPVPVRRADTLLLSEHVNPPHMVKIDVEGAEAEVLRGAAKLLRDQHPILLVATHGQRAHAACLDLLTDLGYQVSALDGEAAAHTDEVMALPA